MVLICLGLNFYLAWIDTKLPLFSRRVGLQWEARTLDKGSCQIRRPRLASGSRGKSVFSLSRSLLLGTTSRATRWRPILLKRLSLRIGVHPECAQPGRLKRSCLSRSFLSAWIARGNPSGSGTAWECPSTFNSLALPAKRSLNGLGSRRQESCLWCQIWGRRWKVGTLCSRRCQCCIRLLVGLGPRRRAARERKKGEPLFLFTNQLSRYLFPSSGFFFQIL